MFNRKLNSEIGPESNNSGDSYLQETIHKYEISELHKEIEYLNKRLALVPEILITICKEIRQFWWTSTSFVGLSWLHDGSRIVHPNVTKEPTIRLPYVSLKEMPKPRLFLDVTATYKTKLNTGVQRVIRELCRCGVEDGSLAPVIINEGKFVTVTDLTPISFEYGDQILLLDSCWTHTDIYPDALREARALGAEIILGIYDLIPIQNTGFVTPRFTIYFEDWLKKITPFCTKALAISRYSATSYIDWLKHNNIEQNITSVGWAHLGANIPDITQPVDVDHQIEEITPTNYMLSVGTVEPRKGYSVSLDAFDRLWLKGSSLSYVIIGREGTLGSHIAYRILNHPQFNKKLFWPKNVNDASLALYYRNAIGVIIPALAEGFGLPLVEASFYGTPIIASDLLVFREIATQGVNFFSPADSIDLENYIESIFLNRPSNSFALSQNWETATKNLIKITKGNEYQIKLF